LKLNVTDNSLDDVVAAVVRHVCASTRLAH
jgi:hypothetical protein